MTSAGQWVAIATAQLLGLVVLVPFCLLQAWEPCESTDNPYGRKPRTISRWSWAPLNAIYGNPEDGVSGGEALIWNSTGTARVPYMPGAWAPWRAYCWSAGRNRADQLTHYTFGDRHQ
jgi:hypothetical protein